MRCNVSSEHITRTRGNTVHMLVLCHPNRRLVKVKKNLMTCMCNWAMLDSMVLPLLWPAPCLCMGSVLSCPVCMTYFMQHVHCILMLMASL